MKQAAIPGGQLAYEVRGDGPPLLLCRPLGGSLLSWGRFAEALAVGARVIAFDPRGVGGSSPAPLGTTTRSMAADAAALLGQLGLERAHVYGISLGGMVASWLAIDAPACVDRLILASTLPRGTEVRARAVWRGLSLARCLARSPPEAEACLATRILSRGFRTRHPAEVAHIQALARARPASRRALLTLAAAAARHDVRARLHEIQAETLLLCGEHDTVVAPRAVRELYLALPHVACDVIASAGHDLSAEAPEATAARVLAHLAR